MTKKRNVVKTTADLTPKQRKFVDVLVANWGQMTKADACIEAGFTAPAGKKPYEIASRLTNPELNPHVCRYLEKRLSQELQKYEKDKLRNYKIFEKLRDGAESKNQYNASINAQKNIVQMSGQLIAKSEVTHSTIDGMSREQLEKRLSELEDKLNENKSIIDVTPETTFKE
jgi:phage terminase small subunit